jgi:copper chaperone
MNTKNTNERLTLAIDGMSCGHCVEAVTAALAAVPAVTVRSVAVGVAEIDIAAPDAGKTAIEAIDEAGFVARVSSRESTTAPARVAQSRGGCCGGPTGCCG